MVFFCFCSFWCFSSFYYDNLLISLFSSYIYDSSAFFKAASLICISISGSFLESIMPCFLASSASFWICCFNCSWTFYLTYSSFFANLLAYWINLSFLLFFIFCWTSNFSTAYALTPTFSPSYLIKKFSFEKVGICTVDDKIKRSKRYVYELVLWLTKNKIWLYDRS